MSVRVTLNMLGRTVEITTTWPADVDVTVVETDEVVRKTVVF